MLSPKEVSIFSTFTVFNTILSIGQWSALPIGNTFIMWSVDFVLLFFLVKEMLGHGSKVFSKRYILCTLFIIWTIIGSIRGYLVAENYWEYKQLVEGTLALSLPIFAFTFCDQRITIAVLSKWNSWMVPLFFLFFIWVVQGGAYHFLIWPVFIYGIYAKYLPKYWIIGIFFVFVAMTTVGISNRAQLIKVAATMGLACTFIFHNYWTAKFVHLLHWGFYLGGITLLILGITGQYNVFEEMESSEGKVTTVTLDEEGNKVIEDAATDTRTFIYQEVILSAIKHDYIWTGRTPARGNDSFMFGKKIAEDTGTNKYERHSNEVCHPNVFTWLGLIGMLLYSFIYIQASWLALYRSQSYAMKIMGCFVAFHWALGWIEDFNRFDIQNIMLWLCIAMCLSEKFLKMDDNYFYAWIYCIFHNAEMIEETEDVEEYRETENDDNESTMAIDESRSLWG